MVITIAIDQVIRCIYETQPYVTHLLTPRSKALLETLVFPPLLKKFPALNGNRIFVTEFTKARHQFLLDVHNTRHSILLKIHF
jgi:hypothetical protein